MNYIEKMERFARQRELKASNDALRSQRLAAARAIGTHTESEWSAVVDEVGGQCVRCRSFGRRLVRDHIIPICHGGSDGIDNLQPICASCNSSKGPERTNWLTHWRATNGGAP